VSKTALGLPALRLNLYSGLSCRSPPLALDCKSPELAQCDIWSCSSLAPETSITPYDHITATMAVAATGSTSTRVGPGVRRTAL
jgi:hypothetical protein